MRPFPWNLAVSAALVCAPFNSVAAPATSSCDRQIVMQIDSAWISPGADGTAIDAFGVAESAGWSAPTLVVAQSAGGVATVDFFACRPEVSAQVLTPIQAHETLKLDASVRRIVIRAKTNSMTVELSR
jgi:hypothetical protein